MQLVDNSCQRCVGIGLNRSFTSSELLALYSVLIFIVFNCIVTCFCAWASSLLLNILIVDRMNERRTLTLCTWDNRCTTSTFVVHCTPVSPGGGAAAAAASAGDEDPSSSCCSSIGLLYTQSTQPPASLITQYNIIDINSDLCAGKLDQLLYATGGAVALLT